MFKDPTGAPKQARSRDTAERLMNAAEELIAEQGLGGLAVAEIVRRASSSVGSFYSRFGDKDGILQALHARRMGQILAALEELDPELLGQMPFEDTVKICMQALVAHYDEHDNLMAAFQARSALDPQAWRTTIDNHLLLIERLSALLLWSGQDLDHDEPQRAIAFGLHAVFAFLGNRAVYRQALGIEAPFEGGDLADALTQLLTRYVRGASTP